MVKPESKVKTKLLVKYLRSGIYRARGRQQMARSRQVYRAKLAQEQMALSGESSNSQQNQDQPSAAPTISCQLLPQFFHNCMDSRGKLLYDNLVTKNEHGHLCTLWRAVRTDNYQPDVKREDDDDSQELERPDGTTYSAFDPRVPIKREPMSDDEEDITNPEVTPEVTPEMISEIAPVLTPVAMPVNVDEECRAYGKFIEEKLKNFSPQTRDFVQHAFGNIIYDASLRVNY